MTSIIISILTAAILALVKWIYDQSIKITKQESKLDNLETVYKELQSEQSNLKTAVYNVDLRIEKKVSETTKDFTDLLHEVNLTLEKLNTTMGFIKDEIKELKQKK